MHAVCIRACLSIGLSLPIHWLSLASIISLSLCLGTHERCRAWLQVGHQGDSKALLQLLNLLADELHSINKTLGVFTSSYVSHRSCRLARITPAAA